MRIFDTKVQELKYKVLREVAKKAFNGNLLEEITNIPKEIIPGNSATMRCCVYKERAIVNERIRIAMGGDKNNPNVIEVIDIACDECPVGGYEVGSGCRGCIAHRCQEVCPKDAIVFDNHQKAIIDKNKCVECGACAKVCPYNAIYNNKRPCELSCKIKAIDMDENKVAKINNDKCISCGACVYQCPFGAISDKSYILNAVDILKDSEENKKYKVYAVVAPSIASQFKYVNIEKVITGIKELGFFSVVEAALGADMVAYKESLELAEKELLTSSCCPAFVMYIEKHFPELVQHVSHNLSPMAEISKYIKETDKDSKIVFIGPCTAKKAEVMKDDVKKHVDCVITFEELQALIDAKEINLAGLGDTALNNASYFGRIFARSGGLSDAVEQALDEHGVEFDLKVSKCDGIEQCKVALLKLSKGFKDVNFIEGMACKDGCIGGAGCLTHGVKDKLEVDKYGELALEKTIKDAVSVIDLLK